MVCPTGVCHQLVTAGHSKACACVSAALHVRNRTCIDVDIASCYGLEPSSIYISSSSVEITQTYSLAFRPPCCAGGGFLHARVHSHVAGHALGPEATPVAATRQYHCTVSGQCLRICAFDKDLVAERH